MKIELEVTTRADPLEIEGMYGGYGVYFRTAPQGLGGELWINPNGAADDTWLAVGNRIDHPDHADVFGGGEENNLVYALYVIASRVEDMEYTYHADQTKQR